MVLLALVLVGLDPLVGVFGSMAGVSTVGMVLLMTVTSIAALVLFSRHPEAARGRVLPNPGRPHGRRAGPAGLRLAHALQLHPGHRRQRGREHGPRPDPAAFVVGYAFGGRYSLRDQDSV